MSVGHLDELSHARKSLDCALHLLQRDERDSPAYKNRKTTKKRHNNEHDHISAWEISETRLTQTKTDVLSDFY